jgi:hypothetical protein
VRKPLMAAMLAIGSCAGALAAPAEKYLWYGWRMSDNEYAIVHAKFHDPTDNDFYLTCKQGSGSVELDLRAIDAGGYKDDALAEVATTFVFGAKRMPATADLVGPAEMLGGVAVQYAFNLDDPILATVARGEPFTVELPKTKTQIFAPQAVEKSFAEMNAFCKID